MSTMLPKAYYDRGLVFHEEFESRSDFLARGGELFGNPKVRFGLDCDGVNDYGSIPIDKRVFDSLEVTTEVEFVPDHLLADSIYHMYVDSDPIGTQRFLFGKTNLNTIIVYQHGVNIGIPYANVSPYWQELKRNVFTLCTKSGEQKYYLNGFLVYSGTAGIVSFTCDKLWFMANRSGANPAHGVLKSLKIYGSCSELQEHVDVYEYKTFDLSEDTLVQLPCDMLRYDPDNSRTLDVSGNANHGALESTVEQTGDGLYLPGVSSNVDLTGVEIPSSSDFTIGFFLRSSQTGQYKYLLDAQNGRFVFAWCGLSNNRLSIYDGTSWYTLGDTPNDDLWHSVFCVVRNTTGEAWAHIDGGPPEVVRTIPARAIGGNVRLFSSNAGTSLYYAGYANQCRLYERALTPIQVLNLHNEMVARHG